MLPQPSVEREAATVAPWVLRWSHLLERLTLVHATADVPDFISRSLVEIDRPTTLAFVNAHALNTVVLDDGFYLHIAQADVILRDGSGLRALQEMLGSRAGLNMNGTDFIPLVLNRFNGRNIGLFGTTLEFAERARSALLAGVTPESEIVCADGFQEFDHYLALARQQQPSVIVLGMGMPKQERIASQLKAALDHPCLIVCGGAILDFLGGKTRRAPAWIRRMGAEWVFRLVSEPRRLFRRYVIGNPTFLTRAFLYKHAVLRVR